MDADRFRRISELFDAARDLDAAARANLLGARCDGDVALRAELEALLARHDEAVGADSDPMLAAASALRQDAARAAAADESLPPRIGRFRIRSEIARGGFGVVLRGEDETIGRDVAVKVLAPMRAGDRAADDLLRTEGRISGRLQHPGIVPIYELGQDDGRAFVAMKVVEGRTLSSLLREREKPETERPRFLAIFEQVCQAIGYAHARGVLHRDLKPHNLMVGAFGEVQVMDWGLAVALDDGGATPSDLALGTPAYLAPEQARGEASALDPRSDVFGLGAILCEILTGAPPFDCADAATTLDAARHADLGAAFARIDAAGADPEVTDLARRCLAADPAARPAGGGAVAAAIRAHLDSLANRARAAELAATAATARAAAEHRARRLTTALGTLVVLVTVSAAGLWAWSEQRAETRRRAADQRLQAALIDAERAAADAAAAIPETVDRWLVARTAAENAGRLATAETSVQLDDSAAALLARTDAQLREVRFATRLRNVAEDTRVQNTSDRRAESNAYREVLQTHVGLDVTAAEPAAFAAALRPHPFREDLLAALDLWALAEQQIERNSPRARWVLRLAQRLDDMPWRQAVRTAIAAGSTGDLVSLANDSRSHTAPPPALVNLAVYLLFNERPTRALELLQNAVGRHSTDFEIHYHLGLIHSGIGNHWQALRYASTATALRPENSGAHVVLAQVLARLGHVEDAIDAAREALRRADSQYGTIAAAADVLLGLDQVADAEAAVIGYRDRLPTNHSHYPLLANALGNVRLRQGRIDDALAAFHDAVLSPVAGPAMPEWRLRSDAEANALGDALFARVQAEPAPSWMYMLARLHDNVGDLRGTLDWLERVEAVAPDFPHCRRRIRELRAALGGALASIGAVERAYAALPDDADADTVRTALGLDADGTDAPAGVREFATGLTLLRSGAPSAAAEHLEQALRAAPEALEVWRRLHEVWIAESGRDLADAKVRERSATVDSLPPLPITPRPPQPVSPADDATLGRGAVLRVGGFVAVDPRQEWAGTWWEIDELLSDGRRAPRLRLLTEDDTSALPLPPGLLTAGRSYAWRASFGVTPPVLISTPSTERRFHAANDLSTPSPIDLSAVLTDDVVRNAGDAEDVAFDPPNDWRLIVDGHGGDPRVRGLPADRWLGAHRLADYDGPNCVTLKPDDELPLRIAIPRGRYDALLLVGASGNGNAQIPVSVGYADGSVDRAYWYPPDWFMQDSGRYQNGRYTSTPLLPGMDRVNPDGVERRGTAQLFEGNLPCNPDKDVVELILHNTGARFDDPDTSAHLFAVTGMRRAPDDGR